MNLKSKICKLNAGMTYVELIVVLGIFGVITSITLFNYREFQDRIEIRNLSNSVALEVSEAQKNSASGKLITLPPPFPTPPSDWKESYGLYFTVANPAEFKYFADLDQSKDFYTSPSSCPSAGTGECMDLISINKGNIISEMRIVYSDLTSVAVQNDLNIVFTRPDFGASIKFDTSSPPNIYYAQIQFRSPQGNTSILKVYASGRIQLSN